MAAQNGVAADRRLRALGESVGRFPIGPTNTIVDVARLRVGHSTVTDGLTTFSGATALVIDDVSPRRPAHAGLFVGNGHGKFVGATQIEELGEVETPIVLTSTLSAFRAADAVVTWVLRNQSSGGRTTSVNPVVGEINDSWLSAGDPRPVTAEHVLHAIDSASTDPVELGNVGGGAGACALGFKGGIGSSSRIVPVDGELMTVGTLVQTNMDGPLRACGKVVLPADHGLPTAGPATADGSCVVVLAVDAPLDTNTLRRLASRAVFALARVGARFSHGSGDYGLAVSTSLLPKRFKPGNAQASVLFEAAMDAVEEAVLDSLLTADTVKSANGRLAAALPARTLIREDVG